MYQLITKKACLTAVGVIIGSEVLWKLFQKVRKHLKSEETNKVLFFPLQKLPVNRPGGTENKVKTSFSELFAAISECKKSLDMCLFLITLTDMASLAIRLMQDGVRVRVIVDHSNIGLTGCQVCKFYYGKFICKMEILKVSRLREAGVRVVSRKLNGLMHHKFAVVDGRVIITGSFNWTSQAIYNNNENVIISSNKKLVEPFVVEFERLWEENLVEVKNMSSWGDCS